VNDSVNEACKSKARSRAARALLADRLWYDKELSFSHVLTFDEQRLVKVQSSFSEKPNSGMSVMSIPFLTWHQIDE